MPSSCCVPNCRGNYSGGPKVSVFKFPDDKDLRDKWINAINRENFEPSKASRVCELHFFKSDIVDETSCYNPKTGMILSAKLKNKRLQKDAIPQLRLPPTQPSAPKRESPNAKKLRLENEAIENALAESIADHEAYQKKIKFENLEELEEKLNFLDQMYWTVVKQQQTLTICHIIRAPNPKISLSVVIKQDCSIQVFCNDMEIHTIGEYKIPAHLSDIITLEDLLKTLKKLDIEENRAKPPNVIAMLNWIISFLTLLIDQTDKYVEVLKFICEQLQLMTQNKFDYSAEMLIFCSLFYNCSPKGYRLLRDSNKLILPCHSTIKKLTLSKCMDPVVEQQDTFLMYIKNKFKFLSQQDMTVSLLVDKIHLKPYVDFKEENIVGSEYDTIEPVMSAFAFMVSSICSKYKDVVHIMPTKFIKPECLFEILKNLITGLEEIGLKIICVIMDDNLINKEAMSLFTDPPKLSIVYPHPVLSSRPLFFLFDSVHLLKSIRNNWLGQKDIHKSMRFPEFYKNKTVGTDTVQEAPFTTLQDIQKYEARSLLKYHHKLTTKAISPTNLEQQKVNLVLQIFNEYTIQSLLTLGKQKCLPKCEEIAEYIKIINNWWTIMNVDTPFKGQRFNNKYAYPLTNSDNDESYNFLTNFSDWLERWWNISENSGKLTKETYTALHHTTYAILEITTYCKEDLKIMYILPGKFQTDHLESRFGQYRQFSGAQYYASARQVFECGKKIRFLSVMKLNLPLNDGNIDLTNIEETNWDEMEETVDFPKFNINITDEDVNKCKEVFPIIVYLSGYCCHEVLQKIKCNSCKDLLTGTLTDEFGQMDETNCYFKGINSGALLHPNDTTANFVLYNYAIIKKLTEKTSFLKSIYQRQIAVDTTLEVLLENELLFEFDICSENHQIKKVEKMFLWSSTNSLLNNICGLENNEIINSVNKSKL